VAAVSVISMSFVRTSDGVDVAVYDFGGPAGGGRPEGPPLLLAHATGFHARCWLPVVSVLSEHFHCYAFDERGHGDSSTPANGDFDWHRFASDALAVVDHFGLHRPFAVGHSCGGALLLLAEMARPGTFRALYCYEPVVMPLDEPGSVAPGSVENPLAAGARRRREEFPSMEAALANFASKPPMAGFAADALEAYVRYGFEVVDPGVGVGAGVRLKCRGEDEARTYENAAFHGAYSRLGEVRCPVTLACGAETNAFGEDILRLDAARLPFASVEVLPGLTHFGPMEDPPALAQRVVAAFSKLSA
jgi:pimeloyl-ACP methyl ester carboxylesterase